MNRRSFISTLIESAVGFSILPSAQTYDRVWKRTQDLWIPNPEYYDAPFEVVFWIEDPPNPPYIKIIKNERTNNAYTRILSKSQKHQIKTNILRTSR